MVLRKIYNSNNNGTLGFTLMEVLIVMAMLTIIASATLVISLSFYTREALQAERSVLVTLLQTARAQSMQNIDGSEHGVAFGSGGNSEYILFTGSSYVDSDPATQVMIARRENVDLASSTPTEIVFTQLSGEASYDGVVRLHTSSHAESGSTSITINYEGGIY